MPALLQISEAYTSDVRCTPSYILHGVPSPLSIRYFLALMLCVSNKPNPDIRESKQSSSAFDGLNRSNG